MILKKELRKAIRAKCRDCSNYQAKEIRLCPIQDCPLWPYRMGKGKEEPVEMTPIFQKTDRLAG